MQLARDSGALEVLAVGVNVLRSGRRVAAATSNSPKLLIAEADAVTGGDEEPHRALRRARARGAPRAAKPRLRS